MKKHEYGAIEEARRLCERAKLKELLEKIGKEHNLWFGVSDCDHRGGLATIYVAEVIPNEGGASVDD